MSHRGYLRTKVGGLAGQVVGAAVGAFAAGRVEAGAGGLAADGGGHAAGAAVQHHAGLLADPSLGGWVAFGEEAPGRTPQTLEDMNEVDHHGEGDAAVGGFGAAGR
jgi:hypothetical protein